jgi:hypothetical protein
MKYVFGIVVPLGHRNGLKWAYFKFCYFVLYRVGNIKLAKNFVNKK